MPLSEQINQDLQTAIKAGDTFRRDTLRLARSAIKNAAIEERGELPEEKVISVLKREIKRRREAIEAYEQADHPELAENERRELEIIAGYLPETMSEEEIRAAVQEYLRTNPTNPSEAGRVIGSLAKQFQGKAEMATVARIVRQSIK